MKKILVNGCSFSRGENSWPYQLQDLMNFDLVNLAQAACGNTYILESTISELSHRHYDFIIIMWSGVDRVDQRVDDIELFNIWAKILQNHLISNYDLFKKQ